MHPFSFSDIELVKRVVEYLRNNPDELHRDEFSELSAYMKSLGAVIPPPRATGAAACGGGTHEGNTGAEKNTDGEECGSEPDEERWVLEDVPDDDVPECPDTDNCTPEDEEEAARLKVLATECAAGGKLPEAVDFLTQTLRLVPGKAMYWAYRADYLLQCARPGAALRDANRALKMNPYNVRALRVRGKINRHLGNWVEALKDLSTAQSVDYDDQTNNLLVFVRERAAKVEKRRREAEEAARQKQREASYRQREAESARQQGAGGFPGGLPPGMEALFDDPEIRQAMTDPEIAPKIAGMMQNPAAALQLLGDPKVGPLLQKIMAKAMGGGGFPGAGGGFPGAGGGFPGAGGGFPGAGGPFPAAGAHKQAKQPSAHNSDDLD